MLFEKEYLGDSVYVQFDGYVVTLTTENGVGASNTIHLEPEVFEAFMRYRDSLKRNIERERERLRDKKTNS